MKYYKRMIFCMLLALDCIYANPVNFMFVWVPVTRDTVVKVLEPLPNHLIKQQQIVDI